MTIKLIFNYYHLSLVKAKIQSKLPHISSSLQTFPIPIEHVLGNQSSKLTGLFNINIGDDIFLYWFSYDVVTFHILWLLMWTLILKKRWANCDANDKESYRPLTLRNNNHVMLHSIVDMVYKLYIHWTQHFGPSRDVAKSWVLLISPAAK